MASYEDSVKERTEFMSKLFSLRMRRENIDRLAIKNRLAPRYITFIKKCWEILESVHPGNCDVQYELEPVFKTHSNSYGSNHAREIIMFDKYIIRKIFLIIRHPEVDVINSSGGRITITDLMVRIPIILKDSTRLNLGFGSLQGTRLSVSVDQFQIGYRHSHLTSTKYINVFEKRSYTDFCMGDADYKSTIMLLNSETGNNADYEMIELLIHQADQFVTWESIEGGPHIKMLDIDAKNEQWRERAYLNNIRSIWHIYKNRVYSNHIIPNYDWKFFNGRYHIVDNQKFEKNLCEDLYIANIGPSYFGYKDAAGNFYISNRETVPVTEANKYAAERFWLPFRGEKVNFKVIGGMTASTQNREMYLNPKIKNYVKTRLENEANSATIRQNSLNEQD